MLSMQVFSGKKSYEEPKHSKYCLCHACNVEYSKTLKFKVGDRVRIVSDPYLGGSNKGKCGIVEWSARESVSVRMDSENLATRQCRYFEPSSLVLETT